MMRLFVALSLPVDVRAQLAVRQLGLSGARWIDRTLMHMTLRFLGDVAEPDLEEIEASLRSFYEPSFNLDVTEFGYFEHRGNIHSLWAGIDKSEPLLHLHAKIESAMVRCGLEPEQRKFTPHVTLARTKGMPTHDIGRWLEEQPPLFIEPFPVSQFVLYQSIRGHGGAKYILIAEYPLYEPLIEAEI